MNKGDIIYKFNNNKAAIAITDIGYIGGVELDLHLFLCDDSYHCIDKEHWVFYKNQMDPEESVRLYFTDKMITKKNFKETGGWIEDFRYSLAECFAIDFAKVDTRVNHVVITASILMAEHKQQKFGMFKDLTLRIFWDTEEFPAYDISPEYMTEVYKYKLPSFGKETSVVIGELCRTAEGWKFKPISEGYKKNFEEISEMYLVKK